MIVNKLYNIKYIVYDTLKCTFFWRKKMNTKRSTKDTLKKDTLKDNKRWFFLKEENSKTEDLKFRFKQNLKAK